MMSSHPTCMKPRVTSVDKSVKLIRDCWVRRFQGFDPLLPRAQEQQSHGVPRGIATTVCTWFRGLQIPCLRRSIRGVTCSPSSSSSSP